MPGATDDIVNGIIEKWSAGFNKLDAGALASLYSKDAFFFGSNPRLYRGREGVVAYFSALPRWRSPTVRFSDRVTAPAGAEVINFAGTASFDADDGALSLSVKISWVIVCEDDGWKIASHHVSSKTPLLQQ